MIKEICLGPYVLHIFIRDGQPVMLKMRDSKPHEAHQCWSVLKTEEDSSLNLLDGHMFIYPQYLLWDSLLYRNLMD